MNDLFPPAEAQHPDEIQHNGMTYVRKDLAAPKRTAAGFEKFWDQVPNKVGKAEAKGVYSKMSPADRQTATESVSGWYRKWKSDNPQASPIHPVRFLRHRRWEDEGWKPQGAAKVEGDEMEAAAKAIRSGKYFLCTQLTAATARTLIDRELVTLEQCREVRINI